MATKNETREIKNVMIILILNLNDR